MAVSSSGPGRLPLKQVAPVRIRSSLRLRSTARQSPSQAWAIRGVAVRSPGPLPGPAGTTAPGSWPPRLEAQDISLSRRRHGFESRGGHENWHRSSIAKRPEGAASRAPRPSGHPAAIVAEYSAPLAGEGCGVLAQEEPGCGPGRSPACQFTSSRDTLGARRGVEQPVARWAHNPEVAGSSPASATRETGLAPLRPGVREAERYRLAVLRPWPDRLSERARSDAGSLPVLVGQFSPHC